MTSVAFVLFSVVALVSSLAMVVGLVCEEIAIMVWSLCDGERDDD